MSSALEIKVLFQVAEISTHFCVLPLVPASSPVFGEVCLCHGNSPGSVKLLSHQLGKPLTSACQFGPGHLSGSVLCCHLGLWSSDRTGSVLLLLCHSGIPGFSFSGKAEVGSYAGRLLPQIFQHIHNKPLVWTTSRVCCSCQPTWWDPGSTSSRASKCTAQVGLIEFPAEGI